jgi:tRNA-Thr(GGU) m(6)t(6)A37 methyltransferase TsaA
MEIKFRPIGTVHSPYKSLEGMPIQPTGALGVPGRIEIRPEFGTGLQDLDGFSHLLVLYHFHRVHGYQLEVVPFLDSHKRGLFATRAPRRPNPIGLSVVQLKKIERLTLHIVNVDILDGTPVLDIKPYIPDFDHPPDVKVGWLEARRDHVQSTRSDDRFIEPS